MSPALSSVLDAFNEEDSYAGGRVRTDGTVIWYGRHPIASRDRSGRVYILPAAAGWSPACRKYIEAVRMTFPESFVSVALPLPEPERVDDGEDSARGRRRSPRT